MLPVVAVGRVAPGIRNRGGVLVRGAEVARDDEAAHLPMDGVDVLERLRSLPDVRSRRLLHERLDPQQPTPHLLEPRRKDVFRPGDPDQVLRQRADLGGSQVPSRRLSGERKLSVRVVEERDRESDLPQIVRARGSTAGFPHRLNGRQQKTDDDADDGDRDEQFDECEPAASHHEIRARRSPCMHRHGVGSIAPPPRKAVNQSSPTAWAAASSLDHAQRPQAGDLRRKAGAVDDIDHHVDVLVGRGLLLCEPLAASRPRHDADP